MPIMDGFEATNKIKTDNKLRHIPIISLTAGVLDNQIKSVRDAGCDAVINKPINALELLETLDKLLRNRRQRKIKSLIFSHIQICSLEY